MRSNKKSKKGISLIVLIITIIIMITIVGVVIVSSKTSVKDANTYNFANTIKNIEEAVKIYYLSNEEMPVLSYEKEPVNKTQVLSLNVIPNITELENEFALNNETDDSLFYYIDISKLELENIEHEDGQIYVVSYPNMYVYYLNGKKIEGTYFYSLTSKITDITRSGEELENENANIQTQEYDGIKVTYTKEYNNNMELNISTTLEENQKLYFILSGSTEDIEKEISKEVGVYNKKVSLIDYYTEEEIENIYSVDANKRYVKIVKKQGGELIGENKIELSKFEREIPTISNVTVSNYTNMNIVKFNASDIYSGVKQIKYDFLTKYSNALEEVNYYENVTTFSSTYMQTNAKKLPMSNTGINTITVPKDIVKLVIFVEDNAGNWIMLTKEIDNPLYVKEEVVEAYKDKTEISLNVLSQNGVSNVLINTSEDGINYTEDQNIVVDTQDTKVQKVLSYTNQKEGNKFIKITVTDNNKVVANRQTYTKTFVVKISGEKPSLTNEPALVSGMTAIKYNEETKEWDDVLNPTIDKSWYDYENKKWANAKTADGSFWVWIPRYEYKIAEENYHKSKAGVIDINFIKGTTKVATNGYTMHPAFTFGDTELTGIWVAKFEATAKEGVSNSTSGDNVTTKTVQVLPGANSWRHIYIGNTFDVCRKMETNSVYGWGTTGSGIDTHLMKNVEWGAAAYLSSSKYGKTGEVTINSNSSYYTGGGTENSYITNVGQSTTGTVYGVYDMSGGVWEYAAAYVDNGNSSLTTYGNSLVKAEAKYKDVYAKGSQDTQEANYEANSSKKGDAVYETSLNGSGGTSWYSDYSSMPDTSYSFLIRGGSCSDGANAGVMGFGSSEGLDSNSGGFRPILVVGTGI